ncbi:MAG: nickel-dependent hydrogenase large subunit [Candidatus Brockarchaeota archaeon]|nr:nickel-dependent hydrogenase large subunit [Candidatus Brockarchaeota archaeon]
MSEVLEAVSEGFAPILDDEYSERGVSLRTNYMYALDGRIVVKDRDGSELFSFGKKEYEGYIGEAEAEEGYGTSPYLKAAGALGAPFRVGPLARLNASAGKEAGTLWAEARHESVMYTRARIVECLLASRRMGESAAELESGVGASPAELGFKEGEGFGVVEAPRGTLLHHYAFDRNGIVMKANVITPTAFNSPAIERDIEENVKQIGTEDVGRLKERAVKVLRDYDPCIPCATHQVEVLVG